MDKKMNFRSKEAYRKWLAYDKMHVTPGPSKDPVQVEIRRRPHAVGHCPHCHDAYGRCGAHCR